MQPLFLSTNMAKKLQQHLLYKSSLGEKISIDNICSFVESNEVLNTELRIQHPLTLPSSCLYLEFDVSENQIERVESNFTRVSSRNNRKEDNRYEHKDNRKRSKSFNWGIEKDGKDRKDGKIRAPKAPRISIFCTLETDSLVVIDAIMCNDFEGPNLILRLAKSMFTLCLSIKSLPITNS